MNPYTHPEALIHLFRSAPVSGMYKGIQLLFQENNAVITWHTDPAFFHGCDALHGSALMRLLDDAAYFTAALFSPEYFIVTANINIRFLAPVREGVLAAKGEWQGADKLGLHSTSTIWDENGKILARASAVFRPTKEKWDSVVLIPTLCADEGICVI